MKFLFLNLFLVLVIVATIIPISSSLWWTKNDTSQVEREPSSSKCATVDRSKSPTDSARTKSKAPVAPKDPARSKAKDTPKAPAEPKAPAKGIFGTIFSFFRGTKKSEPTKPPPPPPKAPQKTNATPKTRKEPPTTALPKPHRTPTTKAPPKALTPPPSRPPTPPLTMGGQAYAAVSYAAGSVLAAGNMAGTAAIAVAKAAAQLIDISLLINIPLVDNAFKKIEHGPMILAGLRLLVNGAKLIPAPGPGPGTGPELVPGSGLGSGLGIGTKTGTGPEGQKSIADLIDVATFIHSPLATTAFDNVPQKELILATLKHFVPLPNTSASGARPGPGPA